MSRYIYIYIQRSLYDSYINIFLVTSFSVWLGAVGPLDQIEEKFSFSKLKVYLVSNSEIIKHFPKYVCQYNFELRIATNCNFIFCL